METQFLSRLCNIPVMSSALNQLSSFYSQNKLNNGVVRVACETAEFGIRVAAYTTKPLLYQLEPQSESLKTALTSDLFYMHQHNRHTSLLQESCIAVLHVVIMPPPLIGGGIKRCFCLTSVCLSVMYIGRNSRTERPRKIRIDTEGAHVTRDSDTTFKVKRWKVKVTRPLWLVVLAGQHGHTVTVTYPYAYMSGILPPLAGLGGTYRGGRPPTACCVWISFAWIL